MKVGVEKSGAAEFRPATGNGLGRRLGGFGGTRFFWFFPFADGRLQDFIHCSGKWKRLWLSVSSKEENTQNETQKKKTRRKIEEITSQF